MKKWNFLKSRWKKNNKKIFKQQLINGAKFKSTHHQSNFFPGTEQRRGVIKTITNNFDSPTFLNDIALLRLDYPLNFFTSPSIAPLCLPEQYQQFYGKIHTQKTLTIRNKKTK